MKPGWKWDHGSRITWRAVWRFSCCRSGSSSPVTASLQEGRVCFVWPIWSQKSFHKTQGFVFVTGLVETARGGCTGQPAPREHILDGLTDCTFPVHALTRCPKKAWSAPHLAGCLQRPQPHHHHSRTSHWGFFLWLSCFLAAHQSSQIFKAPAEILRMKKRYNRTNHVCYIRLMLQIH